MLEDLPEIKQIPLDMVSFGAQKILPIPEDRITLASERILRDCGRHLAITLQAHLACETLKKQTVTYPADWWQAVKERFAPEWFLRRYPVKYAKVILTARAVYPYISLPDQERYVQVLKDYHPFLVEEGDLT